MKEYKKAQEKAQLHGVVNDAYDHDKKQNTQSQNSNDYPKQEYKMDSIHDKIESVHETDQNDLGTVPTYKIDRPKIVNIESTRYQIGRVKTFDSKAGKVAWAIYYTESQCYGSQKTSQRVFLIMRG